MGLMWLLFFLLRASLVDWFCNHCNLCNIKIHLIMVSDLEPFSNLGFGLNHLDCVCDLSWQQLPYVCLVLSRFSLQGHLSIVISLAQGVRPGLCWSPSVVLLLVFWICIKKNCVAMLANISLFLCQTCPNKCHQICRVWSESDLCIYHISYKFLY